MGTLKYINILLHIDIHLQRVKYIINEQSMNINVFLLFFSFVFLQIERERERVYKTGYKEKQSQSHLSYLDGFLWKIFLLLLADRLYLIFSTGLKIRLLLVRDIFLSSSTRSTWLWVPSATNPVQQLTFLFPFFADGKKVPLPFLGSQPIICFYLLPSRVRRPEGGHQVPTSVLNGHSLMACYY